MRIIPTQGRLETLQKQRDAISAFMSLQYGKALDSYKNYEEANRNYGIAKKQFDDSTALRPNVYDNQATFHYVKEKNTPGRANEVLGFWYNKVNHWAQDIQVRRDMMEIAAHYRALLGEE